MTTHKTSNRFSTELPVCSDKEMNAVDWAACELAGRNFSKVRDELGPGDYKVWTKVLIHGGFSIGETVSAATPADYLGVLAWVLSRLPAQQRAAVADAVASGKIDVTKQQIETAKAICEPTRGTTLRRGALKGIVEVVPIE